MNTALGQEQYYIYIQSEEHRSFYVRIGDEIYNSSGTGYLVIPNLEKNTYQLLIGYMDDPRTEWRFNCSLNASDLGFVLQKNKNSAIQLLNLKRQNGLSGTLVQLQPEKKIEKHDLVSGSVSNDPFSSLLSEVVNDPSIRNPIVVQHLAAIPVKPINEDSTKSLLAAAPSVEHKDNLKPASGSISSEKSPLSNEKIGTNTAKTTSEPEIKKPDVKEEEPVKIEEKEEKKEPKEEKKEADHPGKKSQFEPFVVRETPMEKKEEVTTVPVESKKEADGIVKAKDASTVKSAGKEKAEESIQPVNKPKEQKDEEEELKYLPFVIAPAAEADGGNNEGIKSKETDKKTSSKKNTKPLPEERKESKEETEEVKYLPFAISPQPTQDHVIPATSENKSVSAPAGDRKENTKIPSKNSKPEITENKSSLSSVRKTLERKSREGVDLIFIDESPGGARDTIRIFIPNNK